MQEDVEEEHSVDPLYSRRDLRVPKVRLDQFELSKCSRTPLDRGSQFVVNEHRARRVVMLKRVKRVPAVNSPHAAEICD